MTLIRSDVSLTAYNTLGFESTAEWFAAPRTLDECKAVLAEAQARSLPITVLGGGSNVILAPLVSGLVIAPSMTAVRYEENNQGTVRVYAEAGVEWSALVVETAERGLWGIENLALIPGHCGAAPVQNIGAYGVELADVIDTIHVVYFDGQEVAIPAQKAGFGYRDSIFKHALAGQCLITAIELIVHRQADPKLSYGDLAARVAVPCTPAEVVAAVSDIRREKLPDPRELGNVGSFFKNPVITREHAEQLLAQNALMPHYIISEVEVKVPAAWLIDQCGFKGCTYGSVGVHDRQALVLVNRGGGNAEALMALAERIQRQVEEQFGITLEPEPRQMG